MKKIKLIIRVNKTCNCITWGITLGNLIKEIENDGFIKPILGSRLVLGYYNFFIDEIYQDVTKKQLVLQEHSLFSRYTEMKDIEKLKKKLIPKGWKWKEVEK
jgi:hypothetical protein